MEQSCLEFILRRQITNNANCPATRFGANGSSIKTVTAVKYDSTRQLHDLLMNLFSKWLLRARIPRMCGVGGFKRNCKGLFIEFANRLPELGPINPAHTEALRY